MPRILAAPRRLRSGEGLVSFWPASAPFFWSSLRACGCLLSACFALAAFTERARANPDLKFDVLTFCCHCAPDNTVCQPQFDELNIPTTNGHYLAMGSDAHRLELATNGNALAIYYNTFNDGYSTNTAAQQAAIIDQYAVNGFTSNGPKPAWIVLNEISSGLWQSDAVYRTWAGDVVQALKNTYGYNVILYAPFSNPGTSASDWQHVAASAYIGIENYLGGNEVLANGFSVSWCQGQYQSSITSYTGLGVPRAKLMLGEEFTQSTTGTGYGRSGISSNDWDHVIGVRSQAAQNVGFAGFLSYAWGGNAMLVSDDELVEHEAVYRTNQLPANNGITAPFILLQPASQTLPEGSDATFIVYRAGTAATTFQWTFSGTNLPGATTSALTVTNIQPFNEGNYSVRLTNSAGSLVSSNAFLAVQVPPPLVLEPFAPAVTSYAPGANLIGQTNASGGWWTQAGPTPVTQPTIASGSLTVAGLLPPTGNSVQFGGNGTSARLNLGTNVSAGTLYYSFAFKLTDITGLSSSGVFWAGFNNSSGSQTTTPNIVGTRVVTKTATGGYSIGLDKSSGATGSFVFGTNVFTLNQTAFVVGSYQFNSLSSTDDVSQLWINPASSTFGAAIPPPATLTNSTGNDLSGIPSFVLFDRSAAEPAGIVADELRVGLSWASVTPPAPPQVIPTLSITPSGAKLLFTWTTNAPGFNLQASPLLSYSNTWTNVSTTPAIVAGQYVVTNSPSGNSSFYRLQKP